MKDIKINNVSIVIPLYYYDHALDCIEKLESQHYPGKHELILVADNPQKTIPEAFYKYINCIIIKHKSNMGLAKSYNDGIAKSKYDNILFFHEDCVPQTNDLIKHMVKKINTGYDTINAMLVVPESMFDNLDFWGKMMLYRYMGRVTQTLGKASLIKRATFDKIGVFDSDSFRTSGEDCEFYMRLNKNGMDMTPIEDLVDHNHRVTNATMTSVIKKEIQMGQAHGAVKRKYPFKRIGKLDIEYRVAALLLGLLGLILGGFYSIIGLFLLLIPIVLIPVLQASRNLYQTKWIAGGMAYLIISPVIYLIQTYSAVKAFILGRQTI